MKKIYNEVAAGVTEINWPLALSRLCGGNASSWKPGKGFDTRCGQDYYYNTKTSHAWINVDQGDVSILVDGRVMFSGDVGDLNYIG